MIKYYGSICRTACIDSWPHGSLDCRPRTLPWSLPPRLWPSRASWNHRVVCTDIGNIMFQVFDPKQPNQNQLYIELQRYCWCIGQLYNYNSLFECSSQPTHPKPRQTENMFLDYDGYVRLIITNGLRFEEASSSKVEALFKASIFTPVPVATWNGTGYVFVCTMLFETTPVYVLYNIYL